MPNSRNSQKSNLIERTASSIFNIPNIITMARIIFVPLFIWTLAEFSNPESAMRWVSVLVFIIIMASDGIDGAIARKRNQVTDLGKILDPIADKVLIGGALVALSVLGQIPWWITATILVREIGITIYRLVVIKDRVIAASGGGKLKTIMQSIAVGFYLSPLAGYWAPVDILQQVILYVALTLTVVSGVQYLLAARR